jgi:DNA-binding LacI/PurR family transcriptional regulator
MKNGLRRPHRSLQVRSQIPFACFGRLDPSLPQHWADIDNRAAVRDLTAHVLARGHARVAYLGYTPRGRWDHEREAGYRDAMTAAGLPPAITRTALDPAQTQAAADALLQPSGRPAGVVAGSDVLAATCYAAAARAGLRIGPDLAVTGFDGSAVSRTLAPALTTAAIPLAQIADRLIDRVIGQVTGTPHDRGEILPTTLIHGDSALPKGPGTGRNANSPLTPLAVPLSLNRLVVTVTGPAAAAASAGA